MLRPHGQPLLSTSMDSLTKRECSRNNGFLEARCSCHCVLLPIYKQFWPGKRLATTQTKGHDGWTFIAMFTIITIMDMHGHPDGMGCR